MSVCYKCEDTSENQVKCDGCKRCVCAKCSELTQTEMRCMALKVRKLKYFCDGCEIGLFRVPELITKIAELSDRIDNQNSAPRSNEEDVVMELQERQKREKNIILLNVPECCDSNPVNRKSADEKEVRKIAQELTGTVPEIVTIFRLGKKLDSNAGNVRPVKVVLASRFESINILKNRNRCSGNVRIKNDLTPKQQEHLRKLKSVLETRLANGEELTIKYIKGTPKIVEKEAAKN